MSTRDRVESASISILTEDHVGRVADVVSLPFFALTATIPAVTNVRSVETSSPIPGRAGLSATSLGSRIAFPLRLASRGGAP